MRIILSVDCFSFWKIINENYLTRISKNWRHDLAFKSNCLRLLWSRFLFSVDCLGRFFVSGVNWWRHVSFMVMNRPKTRLYCCEQSIETSSRRGFWSIASNRGTHLAHSFIMFKFSIIFFTISSVVTSFGPLLQCSS